jgi:hypothetical protein
VRAGGVQDQQQAVGQHRSDAHQLDGQHQPAIPAGRGGTIVAWTIAGQGSGQSS